MNDGREPIRSYQRIFRPERRIYHLEGRPLPVPGGVPLRWLAYAVASVLAALAIGSGSPFPALPAALAAAIGGFRIGGRGAALLGAAVAVFTTWTMGFALGLLDWPLRLVVLPVAIATLATQATPDGRNADRFALSWLALRLAPGRRSLGRALPTSGARLLFPSGLWVAPDSGGPRLRRGRVRGSGSVAFAAEVSVRRGGRNGERLLARPATRRPRRAERPTRRLALGTGEVLEIRA
ncbi:MAG: hypothetical protein ABW065_09540 [Solirubrobacterales bacterium]